MKEYQIQVNTYENGKIYRRYIVRMIILPSAPFKIDIRTTLRVELTDNTLDALSGSKKVMKAICKFIKKVAPHYEAKVV